MERLRHEYSIPEMAETLGVSPSGFYTHCQKGQRPRRRQDQQLNPLLKRCFERSRRTYGCRRLQKDLRDQGLRCGKTRIRRLMRDSGLEARQKRRFRPRTTQSRHGHSIAPNWLAQIPQPERPGQVWQSDLTYIETGEGWLYLAFTLDSCSRRCVGHHARADMTLPLTLNTLDQALVRSCPGPGLIHHSDRGVQYAAPAFQTVLRDRGITPSMSRKANPYDNAMAESFVATLKTECFSGEIPPTREIATRMIFDFIECFYNPHRRHSALGYVSPAQFEERLKAPYNKGCSGGGNPGGESDSKSRSALAAGFVDNAKASANALSKPPETTRNHTLRPSPIHLPSTQTITT